MGSGKAKNGQDPVACEILNEAFVCSDNPLYPIKDPSRDLTHLLRVQLLTYCGIYNRKDPKTGP
jgi:hypothetical protein